MFLKCKMICLVVTYTKIIIWDCKQNFPLQQRRLFRTFWNRVFFIHFFTNKEHPRIELCLHDADEAHSEVTEMKLFRRASKCAQKKATEVIKLASSFALNKRCLMIFDEKCTLQVALSPCDLFFIPLWQLAVNSKSGYFLFIAHPWKNWTKKSINNSSWNEIIANQKNETLLSGSI